MRNCTYLNKHHVECCTECGLGIDFCQCADPNTIAEDRLTSADGLMFKMVHDELVAAREAGLPVLKRAEALATTPNSAERPEKIALVLHGPEIRHFQISQYQQNREIVDLAAKLDAFNVIDIKMCNTAMSSMGINKTDIPAFVEIVPYGPSEIERLQSKGFIKL